MTEVIGSAVHGNLPEIAGTLGTYMTFRDKFYVFELMAAQVSSQALVNSMAGIATGLAVKYGPKLMGKGSRANNPRRQRRRKSKRNGGRR